MYQGFKSLCKILSTVTTINLLGKLYLPWNYGIWHYVGKTSLWHHWVLHQPLYNFAYNQCQTKSWTITKIDLIAPSHDCYATTAFLTFHSILTQLEMNTCNPQGI